MASNWQDSADVGALIMRLSNGQFGFPGESNNNILRSPFSASKARSFLSKTTTTTTSTTPTTTTTCRLLTQRIVRTKLAHSILGQLEARSCSSASITNCTLSCNGQLASSSCQLSSSTISATNWTLPGRLSTARLVSCSANYNSATWLAESINWRSGNSFGEFCACSESLRATIQVWAGKKVSAQPQARLDLRGKTI